ncbi:DUF305 domain-containing protein [Patulibacter sp. NPDC049589]|uniref:DUF305 domain-containing protein n=1 Tax=Patulibacter sp. NPDC049589 TaxID=3154731 RepID=UPI0034270215
MTYSRTRAGALALTLAGALAVAGCGSSDSGDAGGGHDMGSTSGHATTTTTAAKPADVDRAFVTQMIPHHQMAVEMAGDTRAGAEHAEIRALGRAIVAGQTPEITAMRAIAKRLGVAPAAGTMDHGAMTAAAATLGLSMDDMGMSMDTTSLKTARPFDRAFVDAMIPHHQGAIRMARAELARGGDAALQRIAAGIVAAQTREIRRMNAWRKAWYGRTSPAGGVPAP